MSLCQSVIIRLINRMRLWVNPDWFSIYFMTSLMLNQWRRGENVAHSNTRGLFTWVMFWDCTPVLSSTIVCFLSFLPTRCLREADCMKNIVWFLLWSTCGVSSAWTVWNMITMEHIGPPYQCTLSSQAMMSSYTQRLCYTPTSWCILWACCSPTRGRSLN